MEKIKKVQNKSCELIFILDRSGSMGGLEEETIKGYNSVIKNQSSLNKNLKVTTVLFDNQIEKIYDGVDANSAMLNDKQYFVRGTTAMLDAVGTDISFRILTNLISIVRFIHIRRSQKCLLTIAEFLWECLMIFG